MALGYASFRRNPELSLGQKFLQINWGLVLVVSVIGAVGIIMLLATMAMIAKNKIALSKQPETVEMVGLYWHFVDIVWIIIFTLVYLIPA